MRTIDVDELEGHVREVLRQVQEDGEPIEVVHNGDVVARLTPVQKAKPASSQQTKAFLEELDLLVAHIVPALQSDYDQHYENTWTDLDALVREISKYLLERVDAVEAVREIRREL